MVSAASRTSPDADKTTLLFMGASFPSNTQTFWRRKKFHERRSARRAEGETLDAPFLRF
jgi:hypothetical protein